MLIGYSSTLFLSSLSSMASSDNREHKWRDEEGGEDEEDEPDVRPRAEAVAGCVERQQEAWVCGFEVGRRTPSVSQDERDDEEGFSMRVETGGGCVCGR